MGVLCPQSTLLKCSLPRNGLSYRLGRTTVSYGGLAMNSPPDIERYCRQLFAVISFRSQISGLPRPISDVKLRMRRSFRNPFNVVYDAAPPWPPIDVNSELRLACVARLDPAAKGQDILLEALAHPSWAGRRWRLTLYGDGPSRIGLARLVERLQLNDRVVFAGHVSIVEEIWASNHVLTMPSRWEGLPLAIVEAMLCARPVMATDVGGSSEVIENGVSGILAAAPTIVSVREALEVLWTRREDLREMGKAAAKTIRQQVPRDPIDVFARKIKCLRR